MTVDRVREGASMKPCNRSGHLVASAVQEALVL
jgi:hypothetical protein